MFDDDSANGIDDLFRNEPSRKKLYLFTNDQRQFWMPVVGKVILTLSDQQLFIGFEIFIAGFVRHCSISVCHFSLVGNLAWISQMSTSQHVEYQIATSRGSRDKLIETDGLVLFGFRYRPNRE